MDYNKKIIKDGICFHKINTNKFKTNLFAIFLTTPLNKVNVTKDALISAVLRRGCKSIPTQELIAKKLENMYGANFDCGIEKNGDNHVLKFYVESISDDNLPVQENLAKKSLELLCDIVFNPLTENDCFKKDYVDVEKNTLKQIIESKIDNKSNYAFERCIEEMYEDMPYGLYKYGYVEDLENISEKDLCEYYKSLISNCKIDIFASGYNIDNLHENEILDNLNARTPLYIENKNYTGYSKIDKPKIINENMEITQGKLILGLDILNMQEDENYAATVYNVILGGGANSKLFQNVREKAGLAYNAGSIYIRTRNAIIIRCGIEINNYEKTINLIKDQLKQILNNEFTGENIASAKQLIYASIKGIPDSQDGEISYYFAQELTNKFVNIDEYIEKINKITRQQILDVASKVQINTVYFLKGNENA